MASDLDAAIRRRLAARACEDGFLRHAQAANAIGAVLDRCRQMGAVENDLVRGTSYVILVDIALALGIDLTGDDDA